MEDILPPLIMSEGHSDWRYLIDNNFGAVRVYTDLYCIVREIEQVKEQKYRKGVLHRMGIRIGKKVNTLQNTGFLNAEQDFVDFFLSRSNLQEIMLIENNRKLKQINF